MRSLEKGLKTQTWEMTGWGAVILLQTKGVCRPGTGSALRTREPLLCRGAAQGMNSTAALMQVTGNEGSLPLASCPLWKRRELP